MRSAKGICLFFLNEKLSVHSVVRHRRQVDWPLQKARLIDFLEIIQLHTQLLLGLFVFMALIFLLLYFLDLVGQQHEPRVESLSDG